MLNQEGLYKLLTSQFQETYQYFVSDFEKLKTSLLEDVLAESQAKLDNFLKMAENYSQTQKDTNQTSLESFKKAATQLSKDMDGLFKKAEKSLSDNVENSNKILAKSTEKINEQIVAFKDAVANQQQQDDKKTRKLIGELTGLVKKNIEASNYYQGDF